MNTTFYKIEHIFKKHEAKNTILKDVMWRVYLYMAIAFLLELVTMYLLWIYNNEQAIIIIVLVPFIFLTSFFLGDINRYAKKQLRREGIKVNDNFFTFWPSNEYREKKEKDIFEELDKTFLNKNKLKDQVFLSRYSKLFKKQSMQTPFIALLKSIGGIYILFIIPFWDHFLDMFLYKDADFSDLKFTFGILVLILLTILFCSSLGQTSKGLFFRKQERWKYISEELENYYHKLENE